MRGASEGTRGADVVELRLDAVSDLQGLSPERLRTAVDHPLIATCRSTNEGGSASADLPDGARLSVLEAAADAGFEYVDVEIASIAEPFSKAGASLILSHHDFDGMPQDGEALVDKALDLGADVVKIAARVSSLADVFELARLGDRVKERGKAFAPVSLGPAGVAGRVLAARFGADYAYATARGSEPTGPGQLRLSELLDLYRFDSIGMDTEVYGIVGTSALASLSPEMHNRFFATIDRDAVYVPFQETDLGRFVSAAKRLGVSGLSVTRPFKEEIVPYLDESDEMVQALAAANTVVVDESGRWKGFNTDVDGVRDPLSRLGDWGSREAIVVGAGGAARAAVWALGELGASTRVLARDAERAASVAELTGSASGALDELETASWVLIVNATPVGMAANRDEALPIGDLASGSTVFDMVSVPESTTLIRRARDAGAVCVTGVQMLAAQAKRQAELWTAQSPETPALERIARGAFASGRYSRQVLFQPVGDGGQELIRRARVLVVGVGALGSVSSEMIVRAGVAKLVVVDRDYVDESNLQRQSLFDETDWREGLPKAVAAKRKLARINSDVEIDARVTDLHAGNVRALVNDVDLVLDGTDNFETRYLLNDAAIETGVPWIYAACVGSYGMTFVVIPNETPCLRCLMEDEPPPGTSPTCDTAGVIAPVVHAVAAFQVAEALKILSGREDALAGEVLSLDVWQGRVDRFRPSRPREACPACGRRELTYLTGDDASHAASLCGRNAVQVRPAQEQTLSLPEIAERLAQLGEVSVNPFLLRAKIAGRELVLFKDGRAIVHGTDDPAEARSLYARYVGS